MKLRSGDDTGLSVAQRLQKRTSENASTRILRLPLEIRTMIWTEILAHKTLHFQRKPGRGFIKKRDHNHAGPLKQLICCSGFLDLEDHQAEFHHPVECAHDEYTARKLALPHHNCQVDLCLPAKKRLSNRKLHTNLLRVCKHIYNEANNMHLTSNIFSFHCQHILEYFLDPKSGLKPHSLSQIHKLHLDIQIMHPHDASVWGPALKSLPLRLPNLSHFYLDIHEIYCACWVLDSGVERNLDANLISNFLSACSELEHCTKLVNVMITIEDSEFLKPALGEDWWDEEDEGRNEEMRAFRSTLEEKREAAGLLKARILGLKMDVEKGNDKERNVGTFRLLGL